MTTPPPQPAPQAYAPQSAPNWQGAPGTSYTSPIPVTRTHLGHALASEWTKIKSVRSTVWTLGIFLFLVLGGGLLVSAQTEDLNYRDLPFTFPAFIGLLLGQICLITLGVLVTSSEYGTGMIRTTFTASPQRYRVFAAKILVFFTVSFIVSAGSILLVGLLTASMHSGPGVGDLSWGGTVFKGALYVSLLGVLGLAVGSMLRHSAGAITAMLGLVLLPSILPVFLVISRSTQKLGEKMQEYNAINSLAKIFGADGGSSGGSQVWLLVGVTAAAVAGAFVLLERRDV
ncbi:ABC transporter permease [Streptomyces antnestii]|uniref:ABC transporter permease n=1 Tax=Streptomyces antnestii TaxID=2494256 RepID=A0A437PDR6_9ACTN|nr:ABC transporter permease [Streptomyces sp. San01]RVU20405.1 ABC transporter permease [Streptomyces sp. San01]